MGPGFEQVLAHIAGDKLIGTVVVRVQWSDVFANQEGAPLQANIDDQLGGRGRAEQYGREPEERGTHANDFGLDDEDDAACTAALLEVGPKRARRRFRKGE